MEITGVVLAGGNSRRMGRDKSRLELAGKSMLKHMIDLLISVTPRVVIAAGKQRGDEPAGIRVVEDRYPGCGPLAGVHAALNETAAERILVVTCDLPFMMPGLLAELCTRSKSYDVLVAESEQGVEPLVGVYGSACLEQLEEFLGKKKYKAKDFLKVTRLNIGVFSWRHARPFDRKGISFFNINDRKAYEKALSMMTGKKETDRG
ncbi:molybdenum cofactor guanylyltransferase [Acidobacteriota bacterium]